MFLTILYKKVIINKKKRIEIKRNFGIFNKFVKGVNIIKINPVILLIKNRGYRKILFQKLFI